MALDFAAGCIGGCAGVVVGHPFDSIKVRMQTQDLRNPAYRNSLHCLKTIIKNDSISAVFRGMSSPMVGVAVINAVVFGVQGNMQRRLPNPDSLSSHFASGAAAGFAQSIFCSPMELVKTRMQLQQANQTAGPWQCLRGIYRTEGLKGIFRGLGITAVREAPGFGVYFLVYELLTRSPSNEPISTPHMLLAGGSAGSASWLLAYPVDVIKTRLQVDGMTGPRLYRNAWDCLSVSVRGEGWGCLTRGLTLTLVRAFPVNAATWAAVSWVFRLAHDKQQNSYIKLSELKEAALYLPELNPMGRFHAQASPGQLVPRRYWDRESFGRSPMSACTEHISPFERVFNATPIA